MSTIGKAQAELLRTKFLDTLGSEPERQFFTVIESVLAEAGKEFINTAVANLDESGSVSTGELATSLTMEVRQLGDSYELIVGYPKGSKAAKYFDFNNKGVQGVGNPGKAPASPYKFRFRWVTKNHALAILKWYQHNGKGAVRVSKNHPVSALETKRVKLRESVLGTDSATNLAYATAAAMKRDGLPPSKYFDNAVASVFGPELMDALAIALGGDVILKLREYNK